MTTRDFTYIVTDDTVSIVSASGRTAMVPATLKVLTMLGQAQTTAEMLFAEVDPKTQVTLALAGSTTLSFDADQLYFEGERLDHSLVPRILSMIRNGEDVAPLGAFLSKVLLNPRYSAVQELYMFMEKSGLPLHPDGDFIAYKIVRSDYKDHYTSSMDNSPGKIVTMPAYKVDDNRHNTCSHGLHVCSKDYLPHYGSVVGSSSRVVIVKINPKDVVAVPSDYNDAKMRVARYEVIGALNSYEKTKVLEAKGIFSSSYATNGGAASFTNTYDGLDEETDDTHEDECYDCGNNESYCTCAADALDEEAAEFSESAEASDAKEAEAPPTLYVRDMYLANTFLPANRNDVIHGTGGQLFYRDENGNYIATAH